MQLNPSAVSHTRIPSMLSIIDDHICTNVVPFALIPKMSLTCDERMINATALVKPDETGPETKSIKNPSPKNPIRSSVMPVKKQRRQAFSQLPRAVWKVRREAIAVGPGLDREIINHQAPQAIKTCTHWHVLARSQENVDETPEEGTVKTVSCRQLSDASVSQSLWNHSETDSEAGH
jgi:hypothetical protein